MEILSFPPLVNNSVTTEFSFSSLIKSAIVSSKTINTFLFFHLDCNIQYFCRDSAYHLNIPKKL